MSLNNQVFSDDDSLLVSAFYDRFPSPGDPVIDRPPQAFKWNWSFEHVY